MFSVDQAAANGLIQAKRHLNWAALEKSLQVLPARLFMRILAGGPGQHMGFKFRRVDVLSLDSGHCFSWRNQVRQSRETAHGTSAACGMPGEFCQRFCGRIL